MAKLDTSRSDIIHVRGNDYRCSQAGYWERRDGSQWSAVAWPPFESVDTMRRVNAVWEEATCPLIFNKRLLFGGKATFDDLAAMAPPRNDPDPCPLCEDGVVSFVIDGSGGKTGSTFCSNCKLGQELKAGYHDALEAKGEERGR